MLKHIVLLVYDVCTTIWKYNCNSNASLYGVMIIEDSLGTMIIKIKNYNILKFMLMVPRNVKDFLVNDHELLINLVTAFNIVFV